MEELIKRIKALEHRASRSNRRVRELENRIAKLEKPKKGLADGAIELMCADSKSRN